MTEAARTQPRPEVSRALAILDARAKGGVDLDPLRFSYKVALGPQAGSYGLDVPFVQDLQVDPSNMSMWIPIADGNRRDGVGDLLDVTGIKTERHFKRPLVLFDHGKHVQLPIARARERAHEPDSYTFKIDAVQKTAGLRAFFYTGRDACGLKGTCKPSTHARFCEELFDMVVHDMLGAGSIGYQVIDAEQLAPDYRNGIPQGLLLKVILCLEGSLVVLAANMDTVGKTLDFLSSALTGGKVLGGNPSELFVKAFSHHLPERKAMATSGFVGAKGLTSNQWKQVYDLPADGQIRDVPGVGRAVHYPQDNLRVETVIVESSGQHLRRRKIRGYWNPAEQVEGLQRTIPSGGKAMATSGYEKKSRQPVDSTGKEIQEGDTVEISQRYGGGRGKVVRLSTTSDFITIRTKDGDENVHGSDVKVKSLDANHKHVDRYVGQGGKKVEIEDGKVIYSDFPNECPVGQHPNMNFVYANLDLEGGGYGGGRPPGGGGRGRINWRKGMDEHHKHADCACGCGGTCGCESNGTPIASEASPKGDDPDWINDAQEDAAGLAFAGTKANPYLGNLKGSQWIFKLEFTLPNGTRKTHETPFSSEQGARRAAEASRSDEKRGAYKIDKLEVYEQKSLSYAGTGVSVKSLHDLRKKYRTAQGRSRRLRKSVPGSAVMRVAAKDVDELRQAAQDRHVTLKWMDSEGGVDRIKLTGDDGAIDHLAAQYGKAVRRMGKALPSEEADVTPAKARQILKDGTAHGKPLTDKQRGMFGAIAGRGEKSLPSSFTIRGVRYDKTGKNGRDNKTGQPSAEYESDDGHRVWAREDGTVIDTDGNNDVIGKFKALSSLNETSGGALVGAAEQGRKKALNPIGTLPTARPTSRQRESLSKETLLNTPGGSEETGDPLAIPVQTGKGLPNQGQKSGSILARNLQKHDRIAPPYDLKVSSVQVITNATGTNVRVRGTNRQGVVVVHDFGGNEYVPLEYSGSKSLTRTRGKDMGTGAGDGDLMDQHTPLPEEGGTDMEANPDYAGDQKGLDDAGPEEPYGAQVMRRIHQDKMALLHEYDEFLNLVEDETVRTRLQAELEDITKKLEEIEDEFHGHERYKELPKLEGSTADVNGEAEGAEGMDGGLEGGDLADEGKDLEEGTEAAPADSELDREPTPDEALEGMQAAEEGSPEEGDEPTAEQKALFFHRVKSLRINYGGGRNGQKARATLQRRIKALQAQGNKGAALYLQKRLKDLDTLGDPKHTPGSEAAEGSAMDISQKDLEEREEEKKHLQRRWTKVKDLFDEDSEAEKKYLKRRWKALKALDVPRYDEGGAVHGQGVGQAKLDESGNPPQGCGDETKDRAANPPQGMGKALKAIKSEKAFIAKRAKELDDTDEGDRFEKALLLQRRKELDDEEEKLTKNMGGDFPEMNEQDSEVGMGKSLLTAMQRKDVADAARFLKDLEGEEDYGDEHRMKAYAWSKSLADAVAAHAGRGSLSKAMEILNKKASDFPMDAQFTAINLTKPTAPLSGTVTGDEMQQWGPETLVKKDFAEMLDMVRKIDINKPTSNTFAMPGADSAHQQWEKTESVVQGKTKDYLGDGAGEVDVNDPAGPSKAGKKDPAQQFEGDLAKVKSLYVLAAASHFFKRLARERAFGLGHKSQAAAYAKALEPLAEETLPKEDKIEGKDMGMEGLEDEPAVEPGQMGEKGLSTFLRDSQEQSNQIAQLALAVNGLASRWSR